MVIMMMMSASSEPPKATASISASRSHREPIKLPNLSQTKEEEEDELIRTAFGGSFDRSNM